MFHRVQCHWIFRLRSILQSDIIGKCLAELYTVILNGHNYSWIYTVDCVQFPFGDISMQDISRVLDLPKSSSFRNITLHAGIKVQTADNFHHFIDHDRRHINPVRRSCDIAGWIDDWHINLCHFSSNMLCKNHAETQH